MWVSGVFSNRKSLEEHLETPDEIFARLESVGLLAPTHKCSFFATTFYSAEEPYSSGQVLHDPEWVQGLAKMCLPRTVGELMHFFQAANWMLMSLPRIVEMVEPLRAMLEKRMHGAPPRTAKVASNRDPPDGAWIDDRVRAWNAA